MTLNRTDSFTYNSVDYWTTHAVMVNDNGGIVVPGARELRLDVQELGGANGAVTQGATYKPQTISLPCACIKAAGTGLETELAAIVTALEAADGAEATLVLWWLPVTANTFQVRRSGEVIFERYKNGATFTLDFIVPNPVATGTTIPV
jgi:phage-related protein